MRVFRDDANLAASPDLWSSVEAALNQSEYLILLASPQSAGSAWVDREVKHFLSRNPLSRLGIVLVAGTSPWTDEGAKPEGSSISRAVRALFEEARAEPPVIDLREFNNPRVRRRHHEEFLGRVAAVVAAILQTDKDQVFGEHIRAQRRAIVGLAGGLAMIASLAVLAFIQYRLADRRLTQAVGVTRYIHDVVEERLEPIAGTSSIRRDLLEASARLLGELLGQAGGSGSNVYLQRLVAHVRRGFLAFDHEALNEAKQEFDAALGIAARFPNQAKRDWAWTREVARARTGRGDIFEASGDLAEAFQEFDAARAVVAGFARQGDDSMMAGRQLSVALSRLLAVHMARGNLAGTFQVLQQVLAIDQRLTEQWPKDVVLRSNLATSYSQAADLALQRNDLKQAAIFYRQAEALLDTLIEANPLNADFQASWIEDVTGEGVVYLYQGRRDQAVTQFDRARSRVATLVALEPTEVLWQRMLSASLNNIGSTYAAMGDETAAESHYRRALAILDTLLTEQRTNTLLISDEIQPHLRLGDLAWEHGDNARALPYYERYRARSGTLHWRDPNNSKWAYNLATAHERLGNLWLGRGDLPRAMHAYQLMGAIADTLARQHPDSWEWRFVQAHSIAELGEVAEREGDQPRAAAAYAAAVRTLDSLRLRDARHLVNLASLGKVLTSLSQSFLTSESFDTALVVLMRADSIHSELVAEDSSNAEWAGQFAESSSRISQIHIIAGRYDEAGLHLDHCLKVSRRLLAAHARAVRAVNAASECQGRVALLAAYQDQDSAWLAATTDLVIMRSEIVALSPEDAAHRENFQTAQTELLDALAEGDTSYAGAAVRRLQSAALTIDSTLPGAASTLRALGASVAMDILAAPEQALPLTSALARASPNNPVASCNHAEVVLATWSDEEDVQAAIVQCIQQANTPTLRVVAHAFAFESAALRGDTATVTTEGVRLTAALRAVGAGSIEWNFTGMKKVLDRGGALKEQLIAVFEALEPTDLRHRREGLAVAIKSIRSSR